VAAASSRAQIPVRFRATSSGTPRALRAAMPSHLHEGLVDLVRAKPRMLLRLLALWLGPEVPRGARLHVEPADLAPTRPIEYRADLVLTLGRPKPLLAIVLEAQLRRRASKRRVWPVYASATRARFRCPVVLVVLCVDEATARWAARPIVLGPPDNAFRPVVIGPSVVPKVLERRHAAESPELAVVSALAHAKGPDGKRVARAAVAGLEGLDDERARYYYDLVCRALPAAARAALEAEMLRVDPKLDTPMVRKVLAIGRSEGRAEGRTEGEARGRADGKREALLAFLRARGIALDARSRARVEACDDLTALDLWIRRAAVCSCARDVFGPASGRVAGRATKGNGGGAARTRSASASRARKRGVPQR
jgi:hypothetical protein